jgi:hypothetical protein
LGVIAGAGAIVQSGIYVKAQVAEIPGFINFGAGEGTLTPGLFLGKEAL